MKHLVCVGACYVDTILTVDHYPAEDQKLRASAMIKRRGGNCPNTLEILQQLIDERVITLRLMSVLPHETSKATEFIAESLARVNLHHMCIYRPYQNEAASSYIIRSEATDTRTIVNYNNLDEMTMEEFEHHVTRDLRWRRNAEDWYHFEGRIPDVTLQCIQSLLKRENAAFKVSVEIEKPGREGLKGLAAVADVVFYSRSWALGEGYQSARECLLEQINRTLPGTLLCCTWGCEGALAVRKTLGGPHSWAAVEGLKSARLVIDTVGAGDTFIAGMLYGLNVHPFDWTLQQKLEFANELAGRKVREHGFTGIWVVDFQAAFERSQELKPGADW
ncbi:Ribokinase-like protein [Delitschia confertaspora ATCC 74209]|uniref:Ribokinase-like protein n=1 Tax=Delitschia confertaspora ATCC 74209 TaxID=1513339 RepID=A0A9P4MWH7_9PLEO|nr:Ribokinase-like protein [Delitschia confertaspora ATCC 74209]